MVFTHAHANAINKYLQTTLGREKLCRFVQYFARFYAYYLLRNGTSKETVQRWVELKNHIGNARKFYRLLKPIEFAQTGIKSLTIQDEVIRYTTAVKQAGMFFYYMSEVFVLANAINFYKASNLKQITDFGQRCWLSAITVSLVSGLYKFKQLSVREHMYEKTRRALIRSEEKSEAQIAELKAQEIFLAKEKYSIRYAFFSDAVDFIIPSSNLGYLKTDDGIVGFAGMVTSFMGMNSQWNNLNK